MTDKRTAAPIPPPRKSQAAAAFDQLKIETVPDHMKTGFEKDMSFKVSTDFHTRFKMAATASGLSMKDLLEQAFEAWVNSRKRE